MPRRPALLCLALALAACAGDEGCGDTMSAECVYGTWVVVGTLDGVEQSNAGGTVTFLASRFEGASEEVLTMTLDEAYSTLTDEQIAASGGTLQSTNAWFLEAHDDTPWDLHLWYARRDDPGGRIIDVDFAVTAFSEDQLLLEGSYAGLPHVLELTLR